MATGGLRILILLSLIFCVHCKMIDLDCALFNPIHCQTLLESDDNTFGTTVLGPELPIAIEFRKPEPNILAAPAPQELQNFEAQDWLPTEPKGSRTRQRPPPAQLT